MSLQEIGRKFGTDKSHHQHNGVTYLDIYEKYLAGKRDEVKTVVEIGVWEGKSVKMWREYFPNATIYGVDIDPNAQQYSDDRIVIIQGDQNDPAFLADLAERLGSIDVVIDDGSHITQHQICSYTHLSPALSPGGVYIIEDLSCSYEAIVGPHDLREIWPGMKYNRPEDELTNVRRDLVDFTETQVNRLDAKDPRMFAIHHYFSILIFEFF